MDDYGISKLLSVLIHWLKCQNSHYFRLFHTNGLFFICIFILDASGWWTHYGEDAMSQKNMSSNKFWKHGLVTFTITYDLSGSHTQGMRNTNPKKSAKISCNWKRLEKSGTDCKVGTPGRQFSKKTSFLASLRNSRLSSSFRGLTLLAFSHATNAQC